jgi:hypothetical protein
MDRTKRPANNTAATLLIAIVLLASSVARPVEINVSHRTATTTTERI